MNYWVAKGKRHLTHWAENLRAGARWRWFTRRLPLRMAAGDRLFFWMAYPDSQLVGLAVVVSLDEAQDAMGHVRVEVETIVGPLVAPLDRRTLLVDEVLAGASFLKSGPSGTFYPLDDARAEQLWRRAAAVDPAVARTSWFPRAAG